MTEKELKRWYRRRYIEMLENKDMADKLLKEKGECRNE